MKTGLVVAVALAVSVFSGCEGDQSAPRAPRRALDNKANDDAFRRENETPKRELPTGGGSEFPGQSQATPNVGSVITADARAASESSDIIPPNGTSSRLWQNRFPQNTWYSGPVPALADKPGSTPMVGSTPVPGTPWSIDHSWGEALPLQDYPHRNWADTQATYIAANVKHNPTYYSTVQNHLQLPQNTGSYAANWGSNLLEIPWFAIQTVALPVLMVIEPPLKQVTTQRLGEDPVFLGHLPETGDIVPSPTPGVIRWDYPFLLKDTSNRERPAEQPSIQPIPPTPGLQPVFPPTTEPIAPGSPQRRGPATLPG